MLTKTMVKTPPIEDHGLFELSLHGIILGKHVRSEVTKIPITEITSKKTSNCSWEGM
jgi:hypothetical protein